MCFFSLFHDFDIGNVTSVQISNSYVHDRPGHTGRHPSCVKSMFLDVAQAPNLSGQADHLRVKLRVTQKQDIGH